MKFFTLSALVAISTLVSVTSLSAEEWVLKGSEYSAKGAKPVKVSEDRPILIMSASVNDEKLVINFSNGKQKFGAPVIKIQNGDNVLMRPRLKLSVPLEDVKSVTKGKPLLVTVFHLADKPFEINLVSNGAGLPDVVITSK